MKFNQNTTAIFNSYSQNSLYGFACRCLFVLGFLLCGLFINPISSFAAIISVTPVTWNVIGLDSNSPTTGPNRFPIGARVCSNSNITVIEPVTFHWTSTNFFIELSDRGSLPDDVINIEIPANGCADAYFEVVVERNKLAFETARSYYIEAGGLTTPQPRELYVKPLVSQARNGITNLEFGTSVASLTSVPAGGSFSLVKGATYFIRMSSYTAPGGYDQLETFSTLPNTIFQVLSVRTTYTAPASITTNKLYGDACSWENDPDSPNYLSCNGDGKVGGTITVTYEVKIIDLGTGSNPINSLVYDLSGASYHYNSDYDSGGRSINIVDPTAVTIAKKFFPDPTNTGGTSTLTFTLTNPSSGAVTDVNFTDTFPTTPGAMVVDPIPGASTSNCGTPTFTPTAGAASISFSNGTIPGNSSCTVKVNVTVPVTGTYSNTTSNLFVGTTDTEKQSNIATLIANTTTFPTPTPPAACSATTVPGSSLTTLATWTMPTSGQGSGGPPPPYTSLGPNVSAASTTASFTAGTQGGQIIGTGVTTNSWGANGWAPTPGTTFPSATTPPYFDFTVDTSKYGGARLSLDYQMMPNGDWANPGDNQIFVYSGSNGATPTYVSTTQGDKGAWRTIANGVGVTANATSTGTLTTTFRINATGATYDKKTNITNGFFYMDNVTVQGCTIPKPPEITKVFGTNPVATGGTSSLTFTIKNTNTDPHTNYQYTALSFTDAFPSGMTYVSTTSNGCNGSLQDNSGGTLANGDVGIKLINGTLNTNSSGTAQCSVVVQVAVASNSPGPHANVSGFVSATTGTVTTTNTTPSGSAAATLIAVSPPIIDKNFALNPILTGGVSTLTFLITNPNPDNQLVGVAFSDTFPTAPGNMVVAPAPNTSTTCGGTVTAAAGTGSITFTGGTIANGGTCTVKVNVTAPTVGSYSNTSGNVSHQLPLAVSTWNGNTASDTLVVETPVPAITFSKEVSTSATGPWSSYVAVTTGANVWFRFVVENTGDVALSTVSVAETPGVSYLDIANCNWFDGDGDPIGAAIGTLPVAAAGNTNHVATCTLGPATAAPANLYSNTATATGYDGGNPYSDDDTARFATVGLTLAKNANKTFFSPPSGDPLTSDIITYSFVVTNSGYAPLFAPLLAPVTINDAMTGGATCPLTTTVGDNDNYLDPAESLTCTQAYTVTAGDLTAKTITNSATASAGGVTSNTATRTIPLGADLSAVKTNNVGGTAPDASFIWTITVINPATGGAATFDDTQILLQDDLPSSGATYTVGTVTKTNAISGPILCTITDNTLTCKADGGTVTVPGGLQGTVTVTNGSNAVLGSGTNFDPQISVGDTIILDGTLYTVATRTIGSDTDLTLTSNFTGTTQSGLSIPASFSVPITVNIATIGSLVNPRSGGICRTDPGTVIGELDESNNDCATNTVIIGMPLVSIIKSADKTPTGAAPGEVITYIIQLINTGTGVAKSVTLRDDFSPYTAFKLDYDDSTLPVEPFAFIDTTPLPAVSGLSMGPPEYSNDNGATAPPWIYSLTDQGGGAPVGYDNNVTNWRLPLIGTLKVGGSIQLMYKTIVK